MLKVVRNWFDQYFSDEEAVVLFLILAGGLFIVMLWGDILAPVIASAILAFILQGVVGYLVGKGISQRFAVYLSFIFFIGVVLAFLFALLPLVWTQLSLLVKDIPRIFANLEQHLIGLQQQYPGIITITDLENLYQQTSAEVAGALQWIVSHSIESVPVLVTFLIYLIVVPILVFFFLKDRAQIFQAVGRVLPANRKLMTTVWIEMNEQFANYVRGKVVEIIIVGGTTYMAFIFFDLNYGALLALLVGLSVVIPYIGAVVVTIPVTMIALFQFGLREEFYWVMLAYLVIQMLDGNVLVPLLFSEVVNLHPIIIIVSVLFFGGVWGIWGVFFAIPLATLLKAVFNAWPRQLPHAPRPE